MLQSGTTIVTPTSRYLEPATGRFTVRDPLGMWADAGSLGNGYAFTGNNPWSFIDPTGLAKVPSNCSLPRFDDTVWPSPIVAIVNQTSPFVPSGDPRDCYLPGEEPYPELPLEFSTYGLFIRTAEWGIVWRDGKPGPRTIDHDAFFTNPDGYQDDPDDDGSFVSFVKRIDYVSITFDYGPWIPVYGQWLDAAGAANDIRKGQWWAAGLRILPGSNKVYKKGWGWLRGGYRKLFGKADDAAKGVSALGDDFARALDDIEAGRPRPNVRNPKPFANDGRGGTPRLPEADAAGNPIAYTEHTVNPRPPGGSLDGSRIVTGTDGSAWATTDHFQTWTQIR